MRRIISFDVDGTLVDTRRLNKRAYAGVDVIMPDDAWGKPWFTWLPHTTGLSVEEAREIHSEKVQCYARLLAEIDITELELPAGRLARELSHEEHGPVDVVLLTAGAHNTLGDIIHKIDIHPVATHAQLTIIERLTVLDRLAPCTYVDDLESTTKVIRALSPDVRVFTYVGQSYDELLAFVLD